jgi:23S rRNA (uracil1939-C5)-methyltransferase
MTRRRRGGNPREIEVRTTGLSQEGLGEGRFESRRVLARNALPGEMATVRVLKRRRGAWYGQADDPVAASAARRQPACAAYPRCGGCVLQHLDHPRQLAHKQEVLLQHLANNRIEPRCVRASVSGPPFHYRYKARLGVRLVGDDLLIGFREGFSSRVVRMDDCKTLAAPFARMLPELKRTLAGLSRPQRIPQVELAAGDREFAIIVRHLDELDDADRARLGDFARASGMTVLLQGGGYGTVTELDGGWPGYLSYENLDYGLSLEFLPTDFTQVNPYVNRLLIRHAMIALAPPPGAVAIDLFCGIGNFSLAMARSGLRVFGFEAAEGAVARARHNARRNGLDGRAEFAVADLYDAECPELPEAGYLVLDPPRSGAGDQLRRWVAARGLKRVAYVSCNPKTFASDAVVLDEAGFSLQQVGVFDMFPHTAHVETLGLFTRSSGVGGIG